MLLGFRCMKIEGTSLKVQIITDAPGLAGAAGGDGLLHFDIGFGLCGPAAAMEAGPPS